MLKSIVVIVSFTTRFDRRRQYKTTARRFKSESDAILQHELQKTS